MNVALIEIIFVAVVALGLGFWQLWDVNRELRKHRDDDKDGEREDGRD